MESVRLCSFDRLLLEEQNNKVRVCRKVCVHDSFDHFNRCFVYSLSASDSSIIDKDVHLAMVVNNFAPSVFVLSRVRNIALVEVQFVKPIALSRKSLLHHLEVCI